MTREDAKAMSWALKGNHLKVYPVPQTKEAYQTKTPQGKKTSLFKVKLIIEIGNAKHIGKDLYKQNEYQTKVFEIYNHYYKQRKI